MSFLPDVTTPCEACGGARFEPATLEVRWRGLNVGEALRLTVDEALEAFAALPRVAGPLRCLSELGVGYLQLGQGSHTLSGGEAQRLKLAAELTATARHEPTLYVLDEPTTGLHLADVAKLLRVLDQLVARGDTLVVIEHHPVVIAAADHVVELGPEGGEAGGRIVAEGTPAEVARAGRRPRRSSPRFSATSRDSAPGEPLPTGTGYLCFLVVVFFEVLVDLAGVAAGFFAAPSAPRPSPARPSARRAAPSPARGRGSSAPSWPGSSPGPSPCSRARRTARSPS